MVRWTILSDERRELGERLIRAQTPTVYKSERRGRPPRLLRCQDRELFRPGAVSSFRGAPFSVNSNPSDHAEPFLSGGGEMARLIAGHDWSGSLGPISGWPGSLKITVGLVLHSPVLLWGADGIMIYNDAYSVFARARHPWLLGSKVREG